MESKRLPLIEELHRHYSSLIFTLCYDILRDKRDAEDAVQDTFTRAIRFHETLTSDKNVIGWLYRIGTNVCLNHIRRRGLNPVMCVGENDLSDFNATISREDAVDKIDTKDLVAAIMQDQDERGQQILILHFVAEMSQGEVADALGISRRAVVKRLTKFKTYIEQTHCQSQSERPPFV